MFAYLKVEVVPTAVFAASADVGADTEGQADEQPLAARGRRVAKELATMLRVGETTADGDFADANPARPTLNAEFSDSVPMGDLLSRR